MGLYLGREVRFQPEFGPEHSCGSGLDNRVIVVLLQTRRIVVWLSVEIRKCGVSSRQDRTTYQNFGFGKGK